MEDIQLLIEKLGTEFNIEKSTRDIEQFLGLLQKEIEDLLLHDLEKLRWVLYRIDVPERLADKAFQEHEPDKIAAALTQLIYSRQLEKLKTRKSSSSGDYLDL
jgi:hypothetical protein